MSTACKDCRHRVTVGDGKIWYQNFCSVTSCEYRFDPIEGRNLPENDPPHKYCREVNQGQCRLFKAKGDVITALAERTARAEFPDRLERWRLGVEPSDESWRPLNEAYPGNASSDANTDIDDLFEAAFALEMCRLWSEVLTRRVKRQFEPTEGTNEKSV